MEYAELAAQHGHTHLALTDHGQLYGLPAHWKACKAHGIKPIAGCEMYVNDTRDLIKEIREAGRGGEGQADTGADPTFTDSHLVVLAQNQQGWQNMLALNHDAVKNGYYYKPRTTHDMVLRHSEGLIVTTACIGSIFGRMALAGDTDGLFDLMGKFKDALGDRFLCELHINELPEQAIVNQHLLAMARRLGVPITLASDVHYACMGDDLRQDEMIAVSRRTPVNDPKAFKLQARHLWFITPADAYRMAQSMGYPLTQMEIDAAAQCAHDTATRCSADIFSGGGLKPPRYIDSTGSPVADPMATIKAMAAAGFSKHFPKAQCPPQFWQERADRLKLELGVIFATGMADFYLVTADVVQHCRDQGISCWTRGSGCASLVALCLGITSVDPVRFSLLFERFVDPARPNAPDFDLDINSDRRDEVIAWLVAKYGGASGERVARVAAFGTFGLKAAINDICFTHGVPRALSIAATKAADDVDPTLEDRLATCKVADRASTIADAVDQLRQAGSTQVAELIDNHRPVVDAALSMVGRVRHRGQHAAGYVVGPGDLAQYLPVDRTKDGIICAWGEGQASQDISPTGLMKLDLLALQTLAAVDAIRADICTRLGVTMAEVDAELNPLALDFADYDTAAEYHHGNGVGLHQLSALDQGLAKMVAKMKPTKVEHVVAAVALYRPGSMDHVADFLARAAGEQAVEQIHPVYDAETAETFGIIVYQEQIMLVLNRMGGIPRRDAYMVIKAISKKELAKISQYKAQFIAGVVASGTPAAVGERIFANVEKFAGYGFNKAHAVSYGVLSWVTAYLRNRYPLEFWRAWLNQVPNEQGTGEERKIEAYMRAARASGITLLPPCVQHSDNQWTYDRTNPRALRAPLCLVPSVGGGGAYLAANRPAGGWASVWELLEWHQSNRRLCSTRALHALAQCGAFDNLPHMTRARAHDLMRAYEPLKESKGRGTCVQQLRGLLASVPGQVLLTIPDQETYVAWEHLLLGFNGWCTPWAVNDRALKVAALEAAGRITPETDRALKGKRRAFFVQAVREHKDRKKKLMAFLTLQTPSGVRVKGMCFASVWAHVSGVCKPGRVYLIAGAYGADGTYMVDGQTTDPIRCVDEIAVPGYAPPTAPASCSPQLPGGVHAPAGAP